MRSKTCAYALDSWSEPMTVRNAPTQASLLTSPYLRKGLWLAVEKVVHHDDV